MSEIRERFEKMVHDHDGFASTDAVLAFVESEVRRDREEAAKRLDGLEWSASQGAADADSEGGRLYQRGEEKAYRRSAKVVRDGAL